MEVNGKILDCNCGSFLSLIVIIPGAGFQIVEAEQRVSPDEISLGRNGCPPDKATRTIELTGFGDGDMNAPYLVSLTDNEGIFIMEAEDFSIAPDALFSGTVQKQSSIVFRYYVPLLWEMPMILPLSDVIRFPDTGDK